MPSPSREIAFPFHIGPDGGVAYHTHRGRLYAQRLHQLVTTHPGERLMLPSYGTPARQAVFQNVDDVAMSELILRLRQAITVWEPEIQVDEILPHRGYARGHPWVEIRFSVPPSDEVFSTVVGAGGTIALEGAS